MALNLDDLPISRKQERRRISHVNSEDVFMKAMHGATSGMGQATGPATAPG